MNFFDRIRNGIEQLCGNIRDKSKNLYRVWGLPHKVYDWFIHHEDKKKIVSVVGIWFAVFAIIITVCRIGKSSDVAASVQEEIVIMEPKSITETSDKVKTVLKETQEETTEEITTEQQETEPETTQPPAEEPVTVEREVIPIENINVSKTAMKDDAAAVTKKVETIATFQVITKPSISSDSSRFVNCIDISYHQGKIDWAAVKASGIDYAIIRVGYRGYETGKLGKDVRFDENMRGAIENGVKVGVYFFSQAITEQEALEEASVTLEYIKNYKISLPVVIDWETTGGYRTFTAGLSRNKLTSILSTFCDTVKRYGYEPMVYMCKSDFQSRVNAQELASKYKTWMAWYFTKYDTDNYPSNIFKYGDELPDMPFQYNMWQYSSKGSVNGIKERVDMNVLILPEEKHDVTLKITKSSLITNLNVPIDLMNGVSASGSDGKDATSDIVLSITDAAGTTVTKESAFAVSGKYNLNYRYTDKDGTVVNKSSTLYVRDLPVIYFENLEWKDDNTIQSVFYDYKEDMSAEDNKKEVVRLLEEKLSACYYDIVEGIGEAKEVTDKKYEGISNMITDSDGIADEVLITYKVSDGKGVYNTRVVKVIINRQQEIESTVSSENDKKENQSAME